MGNKVTDLSIFSAINCVIDDPLDLDTLLGELFSEDKDYLYSVDLSSFGYELIEGEYGGEGEGEYCYAIIKFEGKLYKGEYAYYSYHGCNFDNLSNSIQEVSPVQKTITVYE